MIAKLFLSLFLIFIFIILIYLVMVFAVKITTKKSIDDSMKLVEMWGNRFFEWLDAWNKKSQADIQFPVFLGANGYTIRDEVVNSAFEKLYKFWEIYFFTSAFPYSSNVVIYEFRVYNPTTFNTDNRRLRNNAKKVAEGALTEHLHNQGFYNFIIDNFIYVSLNADTLRVHIATTPMGFEEIAKLRKSNP